jgi:hypothetical protein
MFTRPSKRVVLEDCSAAVSYLACVPEKVLGKGVARVVGLVGLDAILAKRGN